MDPGAGRANKECMIFSDLKVVGPEWLVLESQGFDPQYLLRVALTGDQPDARAAERVAVVEARVDDRPDDRGDRERNAEVEAEIAVGASATMDLGA